VPNVTYRTAVVVISAAEFYSSAKNLTHALHLKVTTFLQLISMSSNGITIIRLQQSPEVLMLCFMFGGSHNGVVLWCRSHLEGGGLIKGNDGGSELQEVGSPSRPAPVDRAVIGY